MSNLVGGLGATFKTPTGAVDTDPGAAAKAAAAAMIERVRLRTQSKTQIAKLQAKAAQGISTTRQAGLTAWLPIAVGGAALAALGVALAVVARRRRK